MQVIRESTTRILQACRFPVQRPASITASPAPSSHEIAQTAQACRLNVAMQPPPEELDASEKAYIAKETKKTGSGTTPRRLRASSRLQRSSPAVQYSHVRTALQAISL